MSISTKYNPGPVEDKWYRYWMEKGFFHSESHPEKEPYTIVIPPPNVTGLPDVPPVTGRSKGASPYIRLTGSLKVIVWLSTTLNGK